MMKFLSDLNALYLGGHSRFVVRTWKGKKTPQGCWGTTGVQLLGMANAECRQNELMAPVSVQMHECLNMTLSHVILRYVSSQEDLGVFAARVKCYFFKNQMHNSLWTK